MDRFGEDINPKRQGGTFKGQASCPVHGHGGCVRLIECVFGKKCERARRSGARTDRVFDIYLAIGIRVDQCTWATSSFMEKTSLKSGSYGKMWIIQVNIWAWKIPRSALQASSVFMEPNMPNLGWADW